jgi:transcriptional regulator GlxA family with amidase domain
MDRVPEITFHGRERQVNSSARSRVTKRVALFVSDGCSSTDVAAVSEALQVANKLQSVLRQRRSYVVSLVSLRGGIVTSSSSIAMSTIAFDDKEAADADALIVSEGERGGERSSWMLIESEHIPDALICIRNGSSVTHLAQTAFGTAVLCAGNRGAVHAADLTASQVSSAMIAADLGDETAANVSRMLCGARYALNDSDQWETELSTQKIRGSGQWIIDNAASPISVARAAESVQMSTRTYLRRFKAEFGISPLEFLITVRIEMACRLLVETELPVDKIARHCGLSNGSRLGRLFFQRRGTTPIEFRQQSKRSADADVQPAPASPGVSWSSL